MTRKINFSAGPAALPLSILESAQAELLDWQQQGASVMELSHRSSAFKELLANLQQNLRNLFKVPNNFKILLLHGGANAQFFSVPMNLLGKNNQACYALTGYWSNKAYKEAIKYGEISIATDLKDYIPIAIPDINSWQINDDATYLYYTSNETLSGLQFQQTPQANIPLIADMTSDLGTKNFDFNAHGVIFAGCQKNLGIAGLCIVFVRDDLLDQAMSITPNMFNYNTQANADSCYNTIATFACYMTNKVCELAIADGGLDAMEKDSQLKSAMLYDLIDQSNFYSNNVAKEFRSKTNICFNLPNEELTKHFLAETLENNMIGLPGHRTVGGARASIYNATSIEDVKYLCEFMQHFQEKNS